MKRNFTQTVAETGQVMATRELLSQLSGLGCRFRQKGSHITFHHDGAGVRGTIVSGTRKLWSQKTAAAASQTIESYKKAATKMMADSSPPLQAKQVEINAETSPLFVADHLPRNVEGEMDESEPDKLIIRDKNFPQCGVSVEALSDRRTLHWALREIKEQKEKLQEDLDVLHADFGFEVEEPGEDRIIRIIHSFYGNVAEMHAFDPQEAFSAQNVIDHCLEIGTQEDWVENRRFLDALIRSRKLEETRRTKQPDGSRVQNFTCRRFLGHFGVSAGIAMTANGGVRQSDLIRFLDDVDRHFFSGLKTTLQKSYGYQIEKDKPSGTLEAKHPLLRDVDFTMPDFDALPKLADIYDAANRNGEEETLRRMNDILQKRDDIIETTGAALAHCVERIYKVSEVTAKSLQLQKNYEARNPEEVLSATKKKREENKLTKKYRKALGKQNIYGQKAKFSTRNPAAADTDELIAARMPDGFPYGKPFRFDYVFDEERGPETVDYMYLRSPDGKNLILFDESLLEEYMAWAEKQDPEVHKVNAPLGKEREAVIRRQRDFLDELESSVPQTGGAGIKLGD